MTHNPKPPDNPPDYCLRWIQERAVALKAASATSVQEYEAQWAAEGNPVTSGDGYSLKVGDLRVLVDDLLWALERAGLYVPVVELEEMPF